MVSIQPYTSRGNKYYRIVESKRIDGDPNPVVVEHLGTAETLLKRLRGEDEGTSVRSKAHGAVAALNAVADEFDVESLITTHADDTRRGQDVGTTILLAALNRAIDPESKRGWSDWAETTSLQRFYPDTLSNPEQLTSQYFWDQMAALDQDALQAIERELTTRVVDTLALDLETLFYDTTNFYTYIDTGNDRSDIAKRGRNKQQRHDLRQVGLSMLMHKDSKIPLASQVYEGNTHDSKLFPDSLTKIRSRVEAILGSLEELTLVYDRGNQSTANQQTVDESDVHYVASVTPSDHSSLTETLPEDGDADLSGRYEDWPAVRFRDTLWEAERTFVLVRSPTLRDNQLRNLHRDLETALEKLQEWQETLATPRAGSRSKETAQNKIDRIVSAQHLDEIVDVTYDFDADGRDRLDWTVDTTVIEALTEERFGLRLVMTDRHDWPSTEILDAYHGQSEAEHIFRSIKDVDHFSIRPQFHWTDEKMRVHVFIYMLAYTLARIVQHKAAQAGFEYSLTRLLDLLDRVRFAVVLRQYGEGKPQARYVLEAEPKEGIGLLRAVVPDEEPFVYTTRIA